MFVSSSDRQQISIWLILSNLFNFFLFFQGMMMKVWMHLSFYETFIHITLLFLTDRPLKRVRTKVKKRGGQKPSSFPSRSSAKEGCHAEVRCYVEVMSTFWSSILWLSDINPFTAPACKISRLKDARTRLQTVIFRSYNIYCQCYAFWWKSFRVPAQKERQKGLQFQILRIDVSFSNNIMAVKGLKWTPREDYHTEVSGYVKVMPTLIQHTVMELY